MQVAKPYVHVCERGGGGLRPNAHCLTSLSALCNGVLKTRLTATMLTPTIYNKPGPGN
jgi:hypothetical protein